MKLKKPKPLGPVRPKSNLVCVGTTGTDIDLNRVTTALNEVQEETGQAPAIVTPDLFHIVILAHGGEAEVQSVAHEFGAQFPAAVQESPEEASRHRQWFQRELGSNVFTEAAHQTTRSFRVAMPALPSSLGTVFTLADLINRWSTVPVVAFIFLDTRRTPEAGASFVCRRDGENLGNVGSLGGNRNIYFRVMSHLLYGDDETVFMRDLLSDRAIGPVPYLHRPQWDEETSPLRIEFHSEDPKRQSASQCLPSILPNNILPEHGATICAQIGWLESVTLLLRGQERGIDPRFDDDSQLMMSGYALLAAGLIDEDLKPTCELEEEECRTLQSYGPDLGSAAKRWLLMQYALSIREVLPRLEESERRSRLVEHLQSAVKWLVQHGDIGG